MIISRDEAIKALEDIFNYCEEIDSSLPEKERSGYKMLPDIQKIRKYIIENTRPHGEWKACEYTSYCKCSRCSTVVMLEETYIFHFCPWCGSYMRKE